MTLLNVNSELENVKGEAQSIISRCNDLISKNLDEYIIEEKQRSEAVILAYYNYFKHVVPTANLIFPFTFKNELVEFDTNLIKLKNVFTQNGFNLITNFI